MFGEMKREKSIVSPHRNKMIISPLAKTRPLVDDNDIEELAL